MGFSSQDVTLGDQDNITIQLIADNELDQVILTGGGMNFHMMGLHQPSKFAYNFDSQPWNGYQTLEAM